MRCSGVLAEHPYSQAQLHHLPSLTLTKTLYPVLQVAAGQALASARAAAEDLAPSAAITSRLCTQLAAALHSCVSEAMLAMAADAEGTHVEQVRCN